VPESFPPSLLHQIAVSFFHGVSRFPHNLLGMTEKGRTFAQKHVYPTVSLFSPPDVPPPDAKSTLAVVVLVVSGTPAWLKVPSPFFTRHSHTRLFADGVENVIVQLSTSVVELGVVKLPHNSSPQY
jgi:hypothetical protein